MSEIGGRVRLGLRYFSETGGGLRLGLRGFSEIVEVLPYKRILYKFNLGYSYIKKKQIKRQFIEFRRNIKKTNKIHESYDHHKK